MQILEIDLSANHVTQIVTAKQGDVGRKFKVVLKDAGAAYVIPKGVQFSVWYSGASGEGNYSGIGDNSAFTVEGNTVTVELITQMLVNAGACTMCLVMNGADGTQLGLWNLVLVVEPVPGSNSKPAEQYYTALSEVAGRAIRAAETFQTDATMTLSGKAADAAAVGNMLKGKAPAGYGLGEASGHAVSDCNNAIVDGWYITVSGAENSPFSGGAWLFVESYSTHYKIQRIGSHGYGGVTCQRIMSDGTWGEWEWVNPPMQLGVEYRTTERCEGKPVYAKRINCYAAPASVSISNLNIEKVVRWSGFVAYYGVALPTSSANWKVEISRTNIITTSAYEQASAHFYIDLYYTKA